jgi:hypothetical protein
MVFVDNKVTARYMNEVITDLKTLYPEKFRSLKTNYVVGVGRKDFKSHQNIILSEKNNKVATEV